MKLYTKKIIIEGFGKYCTLSETTLISIVGKIPSIELPSDDYIRIQSLELSLTPASFQLGAKWVIEQIKQQDNGN